MMGRNVLKEYNGKNIPKLSLLPFLSGALSPNKENLIELHYGHNGFLKAETPWKLMFVIMTFQKIFNRSMVFTMFP